MMADLPYSGTAKPLERAVRDALVNCASPQPSRVAKESIQHQAGSPMYHGYRVAIPEAVPYTHLDVYKRQVRARWANIDPLKRKPRPKIDALDPSYYGLSDADTTTPFNAGSFKGWLERASSDQIFDAVTETYCGSVDV